MSDQVLTGQQLTKQQTGALIKGARPGSDSVKAETPVRGQERLDGGYPGFTVEVT